MIFKPGQRVRIKWSDMAPELNGTEGTVKGFIENRYNTRQGYFGPGYVVEPDLWGTEYTLDNDSPTGMSRFVPSAEQLEPIQPERNKVVAWSECLWQPNKEQVSA